MKILSNYFACKTTANFLHPRILTNTSSNFIRIQRNFGFTDRFQARQLNKQKEEWQKEIDFMANKTTYTLYDFRQRVYDGLAKLQSGIKAKFMSGNEQNEASLIKQRKILNSMVDEELLDPLSTLNSEKKKGIALISETTVQELNGMLKQFDMMKDMQRWLRGMKIAGRDLPSSQEELLVRFMNERPISKKKKEMLKNKQHMSKKKQMWLLRNGGYLNKGDQQN